MDIQSFLGVLGRRWWVVVPGLIVVVGLTLGVANLVKPTYKATSTHVLSAPQLDANSKTPPAPNPLQGVGGLSGVSSVVVRRMSDPTVVKDVGVSKGWTVTTIDGDPAPYVIVTAEMSTPESALATVKKVDAVVEAQLSGPLQPDVPKAQQFQMTFLAADDHAAAVQGSRLRAMVATFVLGLILVASLAFAIDALANARAARRDTPKLSRRERRRARKEPAASRDADEATIVAPVKHRRIRGA